MIYGSIVDQVQFTDSGNMFLGCESQAKMLPINSIQTVLFSAIFQQTPHFVLFICKILNQSNPYLLNMFHQCLTKRK